MKESDAKTERDKEIQSSRELEAEGVRGWGGLPYSDWPRLTAIKAHN